MKLKKILKITGLSFLGLLLLLIIAPFLLEGTIKSRIKKALNDNLNAQVDFSDADLSFLAGFPSASLRIENFSIINKEPFAGDTLISAENLYLKLSLMDLIKGNPVSVYKFQLDKAFVNIKIDSLNRANYDIAKESPQTGSSSTTSSEDGGFNLSLEDYLITKSRIYYLDDSAKIFLKLDDFEHEGSGDLTSENSVLQTQTQSLVSFEMGGTRYFNRAKIGLQADLGIDLPNQKYSFQKNEMRINQLPLEFEGFVQLVDEGQDIDINFSTPSSSFKNFLAVIPEAYAKNLDGVETEGDFAVTGTIKGKSTEDRIPLLDINISSEKAAFKYPDLPKKVEDIYIRMAIKNESGITNDTYIKMDTLCFRIDQDVFKANGKFTQLVDNPVVQSHIDGVVNLGNLAQAYPITTQIPLQGLLKANLKTRFDMESVEKERYQNIQANGLFSLSDFVYKSDDFKSPLEIKTAEINFSPNLVSLKKFDAKTGQTDLSATGRLDNLFGYLFSDKELKGQFDLNSQKFVVADFMEEDAPPANPTSTSEKDTVATEESPFKIPAKVDAAFNVKAAQVIYDNITLRDVSGKAFIKDQSIRLEQVSSSLFGGKLALNGMVSTQTEKPLFEMNLGVNQFDIEQSFQNLSMFQNLTPLAVALQGQLNSNINLKGALNDDMSVNLQSLTGNLLANLIGAKFKQDSNKNPLVAGLSSQLSFLDLTKLNLNDLKAQLEFQDGGVKVNPFTFKYQDIAIDVSGTHSFDKSMSYNATFNIPAKYLGSQAAGLLANLSGTDAQNVTVPITANIGGSFSQPVIKTDMQSAVQNLTQQLMQKQKDQLVQKGTGALGNLLGGGQTQTADTLVKKDSTATKKPVEEAAKSLLNNLLGGKKKKKDTVN